MKHTATTIHNNQVSAMSLWGLYCEMRDSGMIPGDTAIVTERDGCRYKVVLLDNMTFKNVL